MLYNRYTYRFDPIYNEHGKRVTSYNYGSDEPLSLNYLASLDKTRRYPYYYSFYWGNGRLGKKVDISKYLLLTTLRKYTDHLNKDRTRERRFKEIEYEIEHLNQRYKNKQRFEQRLEECVAEVRNRVPKILHPLFNETIAPIIRQLLGPVPEVYYTDTNGVHHNLTEMQ